jgi:hypothetical protein
MQEGLYKVLSWNGKDGVLTNEEGVFHTVTLYDLSEGLNRKLIVGETVSIKLVVEGVRMEDDKSRFVSHLRIKEWARLKAQEGREPK